MQSKLYLHIQEATQDQKQLKTRQSTYPIHKAQYIRHTAANYQSKHYWANCSEQSVHKYTSQTTEGRL